MDYRTRVEEEMSQGRVLKTAMIDHAKCCKVLATIRTISDNGSLSHITSRVKIPKLVAVQILRESRKNGQDVFCKYDPHSDDAHPTLLIG